MLVQHASCYSCRNNTYLIKLLIFLGMNFYFYLFICTDRFNLDRDLFCLTPSALLVSFALACGTFELVSKRIIWIFCCFFFILCCFVLTKETLKNINICSQKRLLIRSFDVLFRNENNKIFRFSLYGTLHHTEVGNCYTSIKISRKLLRIRHRTDN